MLFESRMLKLWLLIALSQSFFSKSVIAKPNAEDIEMAVALISEKQVKYESFEGDIDEFLQNLEGVDDDAQGKLKKLLSQPSFRIKVKELIRWIESLDQETLNQLKEELAEALTKLGGESARTIRLREAMFPISAAALCTNCLTNIILGTDPELYYTPLFGGLLLLVCYAIYYGLESSPLMQVDTKHGDSASKNNLLYKLGLMQKFYDYFPNNSASTQSILMEGVNVFLPFLAPLIKIIYFHDHSDFENSAFWGLVITAVVPLTYRIFYSVAFKPERGILNH